MHKKRKKMLIQSNLSNKIMHLSDRVAAIRFMLTIPLGEPYGITALPDYVFTYIYEVGAMQDLPWITWVEDDTGARIYRWRVTESPREVWEMSKDSQLLRSLYIGILMNEIRYERMGVDGFETSLLLKTRSWRK